MKTRILTLLLVVASVATFAQNSRRHDNDSRSNPNSRSSSVTKEEKSTTQTQPGHSGNRREPAAQTAQHRDNRSGNTTTSTRQEPARSTYTNNANNNNHYNTSRGQSREVTVNRTSRNDGYFSYSHRRPVLTTHHRHHVEPLEVRRVRYPYRAHVRAEIIWTSSMHKCYRSYYPEVHYWRYPVGHRIAMVSAYDARDYIGEVANIYGKVEEVYYDYDSDWYILYFGDYFPYHDFSISIPGYEARRFSRNPEFYFRNSYTSVTGYISYTDGKPSIVVKNSGQVEVY